MTKAKQIQRATVYTVRVAPHFPGHVRAVLPPEWLAPLRQSPVSVVTGHA